MSRHHRFIERTLEIAATSEHRWMHGSLVVAGSRILASAPNRFRNDPWLTNGQHATYHAEMAALRQLRFQARGATVYVARVNNQGEPRLARPCDNCHIGLTLAGCSTMVYTENDGTFTIERVYGPVPQRQRELIQVQ